MDTPGHGEVGDLINEEAKLIAAVKKNDRQRYKDLPER